MGRGASGPNGGDWPDASNRHQRDEVVPSVDSPELIGGLRLAHNGHNRFPGTRVSAALRLKLRPLPGCLVCPIVPEKGGYGPDGGRIFRPGPAGSCAGVEAVHAGPFNGPGEFIPRRLKPCRLIRCQGINGLRAAGAWRHGAGRAVSVLLRNKPLRPFPLRSNQLSGVRWRGRLLGPGRAVAGLRTPWPCLPNSVFWLLSCGF
jgi:hypothetical protein